MKIVISKEAHVSIGDIFDYAIKLSPNYANKTIYNIYLSIDMLKIFPFMGRIIAKFKNKNLREIFYEDYRIIYFVIEKQETIYIEYVLSKKQNMELFFSIHKREIYKLLNQFFN